MEAEEAARRCDQGASETQEHGTTTIPVANEAAKGGQAISEAEATEVTGAADAVPLDPMRLETAILNTLAAKRTADATAIRQHLCETSATEFAELDAAQVRRALLSLKEQWAVYEVAQGVYQCL